ncbi:uncharacterized protein LOC131937372 isoform X2 [Physella acuta]|nr:uncharacterized protein LOC131937372 isoform X2 [Physella acuta]XP_059150736.1 uncharacterized protein LOC131937372 isoform X2 [Physella acuta]XP_059150737.1 uncharacterized protein LOC131937372 isoform X2 [Physella acuta]XP_059150738.1 uncharacterized protein LOC131937372 isoform X2 [Physella acuta]XP_059150739.1 uncharacterized protein LOC131937372 isoform X2 [Physella acuta]XP_059150740.1 uncharacterized protein LOC131937372 isoform X2 [Physella acuta]
MNRNRYGGYSPLRAKRRQSDAKWRASVATCYDALKYVVPNVKHLSKRKISKALILQESEKHIKDLEDAISYLLNVECGNKGKAVLWREGAHWSHCTLDKLRAQFSEKQRRVFHASVHGRRCYNLLHDIKDEVFNMKADPKLMAFVKETTEKNFVLDNINSGPTILEEENRDISVADGDVFEKHQTIITANAVTANNNKVVSTLCKGIPRFPYLGLNKHHNQEHQSERRLHIQSNAKDSHNKSLHVYKNESKRLSNTSSEVNVQTVPCLKPGTPESSLNKIDVQRKSNKDKTINIDKQDRVENSNGGFYILSEGGEYTCLLKALESDNNDQEVPSVKSPKKIGKIKPPGLICVSSESDYSIEIKKELIKVETEEFTSLLKDVENVGCNNKSTNQTSALDPKTSAFSSPWYSPHVELKKEIKDFKTPRTSGDPFLNSMCSPKLEVSLCSNADNEFTNRRSGKFVSARKRLNFNIQPTSVGTCSIFGSHMLSPDRWPSPVSTSSFTPVKLPDDTNCETSNPLDSFVSPWKVLHSPFDSSKIGSQSYLNNSTGLEDSLLCLETMDAIDEEEENHNEITPAQHKKQKQQEGTYKRKLFVSPETSKSQPKCRRRLERLYNCSSGSQNVDDSHVVPQLELTILNDKLDEEMAQSNNESLATDSSDFDGFYFYYRQVSQQLKDKLGSHDLDSQTVAAKVAHMWTKLAPQEKSTMSTLANLEVQNCDEERYGTLSQDLDDVKPLDPLEFIPSFM